MLEIISYSLTRRYASINTYIVFQGFIRPLIPKVCSADHWWSSRLAQVVHGSLYKSIFCASQSTKIYNGVCAPEKFGNPFTGLSFGQFLPLFREIKKATRTLNQTAIQVKFAKIGCFFLSKMFTSLFMLLFRE